MPKSYTLQHNLAAMNEPVLSIYLHVDNARRENQSDNPAWRIELKNQLRAVEPSDETARWQACVKQVETFLQNYTPNGRTLVLFCDGEHLTEDHLPVALPSRATFGEPDVLPLLWALDEYEPYLIIQVDQEGVRFINATLGGAAQAGEMEFEIDAYDFREKRMTPAMNSENAAGGRDRDGHTETIEAHRQRFYREVVEHTQTLKDEMGVRRILLSGDEQAAVTLQREFNDTDAVIGIAPAPMTLSEAEVVRAVRDTAIEYERQNDTEIVDSVIEAAKSGGRGALGAEAVMQALQEGRIELLVLPYPPADRSTADAILNQAYETGTALEIVHGEPAHRLIDEGGVGARLYYTYDQNGNS